MICDLVSEKVIASSKFPTTHQNLTLCIEDVLDGLPPDLLREARLICLSTTLATNAIVEEKGGNTCLLLLLGYDSLTRLDPYSARVVRLRDGHDVRGEETEPLDEDDLLQTIRENSTWADTSIRILSLENEGAVFRASLTPTDIFNASGDSEIGDAALSKAAVDAASQLLGVADLGAYR
ncbi:MAG: hydantoinase/oxoprolinase N-terminal domain-containing protein [Actinomycetota bacterium]|nr:hydantoinase/oxoprolinase N-terminal domain-containing protein [Actinomycetota bacterium]